MTRRKGVEDKMEVTRFLKDKLHVEADSNSVSRLGRKREKGVY